MDIETTVERISNSVAASKIEKALNNMSFMVVEKCDSAAQSIKLRLTAKVDELEQLYHIHLRYGPLDNGWFRGGVELVSCSTEETKIEYKLEHGPLSFDTKAARNLLFKILSLDHTESRQVWP